MLARPKGGCPHRGGARLTCTAMRATAPPATPAPLEETPPRRRPVGLPPLEVAAMALAAVLAIVWAIWLPPVRDLAGHERVVTATR